MNVDEGSATVLVAVMNDRRDLARAQREGWYRIPLRTAPRPLASDYLAFYLTAAFGEERWSVRYYAEVWRYELRQRRDILPEEAEHPRARDLYYRLHLGTVQALERPIPSRSLRRVTFIYTSMERLLTAADVRHLWPDRPMPRPAESLEGRHVLWGPG